MQLTVLRLVWLNEHSFIISVEDHSLIFNISLEDYNCQFIHAGKPQGTVLLKGEYKLKSTETKFWRYEASYSSAN